MNKSFLIVHSNIRKAKGQTIAIIILILLAALMMNLWLMLSMDYKRNFDRYHDKLNAEHVTLAMEGDGDALRSFIAETLDKERQTTQYSIDDVLLMNGSFAYNGGELDQSIIVLEEQMALNRPVGKLEIVEEGEFTSGVYLPMIYGTDPEISVGKTIDITIGNHVVSYTICGFFDSVMVGSHNCGMLEFMLTKDKYQELKEKNLALRATLVSVRISEKDKSEEFEAALKNEISSQYPSAYTISNAYTMVSTSRYISQMICSGIVRVMAFCVILIAMVVIVSNVLNYIQENMKNLGVLKAVGYKSSQIMIALLIQFVGITFFTAIVGIGLSYCLFPAVNTMMIAQTGIPYTMRFLPLPLAITLMFICGVVALAVWLPARKVKNIEPITALRQGIQTHSFKRNHIPLDKAHSPVWLALALKTTLSGMKQNVTICITMLVLSLVVVFSGLMLENVIIDVQPFVALVMGEVADSHISINAEIENQFIQAMSNDQRVQKIYFYQVLEIRHAGGIALSGTVAEDFAMINNQSICFDGRFPKYDNETAIGARYAKEKGLKIGDEITLTADGNEAVYIISGLTQVSNYLGRDCWLTRSGYERMGTLQDACYNLYLADEVDVDTFHTEVSRQFGDNIIGTQNVLAVINSACTVYITLMTVIVIAVLILSVAVITFVLYLLVRTLLNNKKHDYGIMKALGFTTGQLILQTAVSFMPTVIVSMAAGLIICSLIINPLTAIFLSGIGIVKCTFALPVGFIMISGIGLVLFAFGMACLLSLKIRKIAPRALLTGE